MTGVNDEYDRGFARDLRARNRSPRTISNYQDATRALRVHLKDRDLAEVTRQDLIGFLDAQLTTHRPAGVGIRYRALRQFFKWMAAEDITAEDPSLGVTAPTVPEQPVTVLTIPQVTALLATCGSKSFRDRRDAAIIRLFLEPGGLRLAELVGLQVRDVDLDNDLVTVMGKGRRERTVPFGAKTGIALARYVRDRAKHPQAGLTVLWLGGKGPLTRWGVQQMLRRRATTAGIPHLHPHMLRHTAAHEWLAAGGQETDAMALFGWTSREMVGRYGKSVADERAREASRRLGLGDRY